MAEQSKLTGLDRTRAKAHYNFHMRLRKQKEEDELNSRLNSGNFDFDAVAAEMNPDLVEKSKKKNKTAKKAEETS